MGKALIRMDNRRLLRRIMVGTLENPGRRGRGGKEKEWTDCVADDPRLFGIGDLACHSHMTIDLASLQSRDGARRVFAGRGSKSITKREAPWCVRRVA